MINPYDVVVDVIHVDDDTDDDKAWRRRDLLLAGQPAALSALSVPCPKKIFDSENPGSARKNQ